MMRDMYRLSYEALNRAGICKCVSILPLRESCSNRGQGFMQPVSHVSQEATTSDQDLVIC
jgi:hypothetical protein